MTFAVEAWPFVLPPALAALVLLWLEHPRWALVAAFVAVCVLLFFRIPNRHPQAAPGALLAPANGVVTRVDRVADPAIAPGELQRIVTFLSVFNVHVQRAPAAGEVVSTTDRPGRKVAAFRADAGEVNESRLTVLRLADGNLIGIRQIAGLLARRIVGHVEEGDRVERGELIGLIKFGSRVDLYVPTGYSVLVNEGQKLIEGETPVAIAATDPQP